MKHSELRHQPRHVNPRIQAVLQFTSAHRTIFNLYSVNEHWQTINAYVNLQCLIISSVGENLFGEKLCKFFKLLQIYQKTPYRFSIIDNLYGVYS